MCVWSFHSSSADVVWFLVVLMMAQQLNSSILCPKHHVPDGGQCKECGSSQYVAGHRCRDCGHCLLQACADVNGFCKPSSFTNPVYCAKGYKPKRCTDRCGKGDYGHDCKEKCGACKQATCDPASGSCQSCRAGFRGSKCTTKCTSHFYGENCEERCGACYYNFPCNITSGTCEKCKAGFVMPLCKSRCREGRYGQGCQNTCGHCGRNTTCDSETGHCQICQSGFKPPLCDTECEGGMYGTNCLQQCGLCAEGAACDRVTGHCPGQCQGDQDPPLCTKRRECEEEFYGTACSQRCGECRYLPCDEFTGHCTCPVDLILNNTPCVPCRSALVPPLCLDTTEKPEAEEKSQPWLGPSLGVGAGITGLVLIGVIVLYFLRRRRPDSTDKRGILLRLKVPEPEPVVPASRRAMSLNSLVLTRPPLFHSRSFHGYRPRSFSVPSRSFRPAPSSRSHISRFSDTATNLSDSSITSSVV